MSVQYHYQRMADSLSHSGSSLNFSDQSQLSFTQAGNRPGVRWPKIIGIMQIALGLLIAFLGLMEVAILPMMEDHTAAVQFNKATCFGAGLYAGLVMVVAGSVAVRASLCKRKTSMHKFYNLTLVALLVYAGLTLLLVVAYSRGWNSEEVFPAGSHRGHMHLAVTVLMVVGLMLALASLVMYYDVVCCGEMQLWHWWSHCLCDLCTTQSQTHEPDPGVRPAPVAMLI